MKLVINKRYGGFGLSYTAMMRIFDLKEIEVYPFYRKFISENRSYTFQRIDKDFIESGSIMSGVSYFESNPKEDNFSMTEQEYYGGGGPGEVFLDFEGDFRRNDISLVQAVEELGRKANGRFSRLKIVEIPENHSYRIRDYDGVETVYHGIDLGEK